MSGAGKIVYIAGQLARDVDSNCVGKGDMRAQMEQTFKNLDRCLKAAGATWADVVKTNTFVTDFDSPRTTKLYDRRREQVAQDEVERIRF